MATIDNSRHLTSTMAHKFDRLEKFFSKKKTTTTSQTTASPRSSTGSNISSSSIASSVQAEAMQPLFPPPSFIRPKASRMLARDEAAHVPRTNARLRSPPATQRSSRRLSSNDAHEVKALEYHSANSSTSSLRIPNRSSSLLSRRRESPLNGMTPLRTTNLRRRSTDASSCLTIAIPRKPHTPAKCLQDALPIYPAARVDTPPPSDQDDNYSPTTPPPDLHKCLPPAPLLMSQPTPDPSPEMLPMRDSLLSEPRSSAEFTLRTHLRSQSEETPGLTSPQEIPLRKVVSDSNLPSTPKISDIKRDLVLAEPQYREFLSLSDEDVAGEKKSLIPAPLTPARPPPRHLPPSPPVPPPSARIPAPLSPCRAGIMPSSPLTGVPAALAALEAARIAKKYDFDLLYIVNLWPTRLAHAHNRCTSGASSSPSSPPASPTSSVSPAPWLAYSGSNTTTPRNSIHPSSDGSLCMDNVASCTSAQSGMTSRLLTGYGLAQLRHPFRLSTPIHKKFLRANGWVEFRQDDAKPEEFARGYACSFYTGHSPEARHSPSEMEQQSAQHTHANGTKRTAKPGAKKRRNNRGIVFAAYRKARTDDGSICSGAAELAALHRDAETLVELLLDFHQVQRPDRGCEMVRRASEGSVPTKANM